MSDTKRAKRRSSTTNRASQTPAHDAAHQLELHAIEEQFLSDWRAGLRPLLSTYLRRYPDYSAELATFVARSFMPDSQSGALLLIDDIPAYELRVALSSGTRRALEAIFGADADIGPAASPQARVAEERAGYMDGVAPTAPTEDQSE